MVARRREGRRKALTLFKPDRHEAPPPFHGERESSLGLTDLDDID
jgi:hypothetical protein